MLLNTPLPIVAPAAQLDDVVEDITLLIPPPIVESFPTFKFLYPPEIVEE
mgnify:CR=1 FL=1